MRIIHGLSWTMVGTGSNQIMGLLIGVFVSNYLGLKDFGKYGILISTIGMLGMFAGMSMGYTVTRFVAEYRSDDPAKSGRYIGMTTLVCLVSSLIAASVMAIFSGFLSKLLFKDVEFASLLVLAAPILVFTALNGVSRSGFVGLELFRPLALLEFFHSFLRIFFIIAGAFLYKLYGVVGGWVMAEAITFIALHYYLGRRCSDHGFTICYRGSQPEWRALWRFTIPSFMSNIIMNPANWICNVMIVNLPNGLYYMGVLTAARQIQSAVSFVPMRLMKVTLPVMSNLFGKKSIAKYYKLALYTQTSILGISLLIALPLMIFSRFIMSIYGDDFAGDSLVLIIMLMFGLFYILEVSLAEVLLSQGQSLKKFWVFSGVTLFSLALFGLVFLQYGALGYAISMAISHFLGVLILAVCLILIRKKDLESIK